MDKLTVFLVLLISVTVMSKDVDFVRAEKRRLLDIESKSMLGSDIILSDNEVIANNFIMDLKLQTCDDGYLHPELFNVSKHFFKYKDEVKKTKLFQIIKDMPKGGLLHGHDTGFLSADYVLTLTYWDDLFVCFTCDDIMMLFSNKTPEIQCPSKWQLMKEARFSSGNVKKFDEDLKKHFSIIIDDPGKEYTDINKVWGKFADFFIRTGPLFSYKPIWEQYFFDTLRALKNDNIMYLEIRSVLPPLYDLNGNMYDSVETAKTYYQVYKDFKRENPDFLGAKLIYAPLRTVDHKTMKKYIKTATTIKNELPHFFAGFDLVGQEDLGFPTEFYLDLLAEAAEKIDFFFHAGETNWYGLQSDENLFDVILLGTKRIGHAFGLVKHPALLEEVKKRNIGIEVNVISNSVLKLVDDVRNHPLAIFLANDFPVVISSDDPGLWGADPLSHDFYVTFVGVASRHADLKLLKKLALNSLYYSSAANKDKLVHEFEIRWTRFIDNIVKDLHALEED